MIRDAPGALASESPTSVNGRGLRAVPANYLPRVRVGIEYLDSVVGMNRARDGGNGHRDSVADIRNRADIVNK